MIVAQITDFHTSHADSEIERRFGTTDCLAGMVEHLNGLDPQPTVVLATGDLVNEGETQEYDRLVKVLKGLKPPLYVVPGNHDDRTNLRKAFGAQGYLPANGSYLHYLVDDYPVRLIGLDTQVPGKAGGELCAERLAWLSARLEEAPARPTLLFMHHPPFRTGMKVLDDIGLSGREALRDLVKAHPQVQLLIAGHVHRPIVKSFGGTSAVSSPSTAYQFSLALSAGESLRISQLPPACMLHLWLGPEEGFVSHQIDLPDLRPAGGSSASTAAPA